MTWHWTPAMPWPMSFRCRAFRRPGCWIKRARSSGQAIRWSWMTKPSTVCYQPIPQLEPYRAMKTTLFSALVALALSSAFPASSAPAAEGASDVPIPFKKFALKNGLTLIVHEDHKEPIVCVNVWYHVGSKNERPGKTGFAHLFEHLMFNGSEHFDDDYF